MTSTSLTRRSLMLAGELLGRGYTDVTVADTSADAIERAKSELGDIAQQITWLQADLRSHRFDRRYDLWHDRAAFHFMVGDADRENYLAVLRAAIRPRRPSDPRHLWAGGPD